MNVIGPSFAYHQLSVFQSGGFQSGLQDMQAHNTGAPAPASGSTPSGPYMPVAGSAFVSSGYFAVAPQMASFGGSPTAYPGQMGSPAVSAATGSSTSGGGHVTANATNSMTSPAMTGMPQMGGAGMGGVNFGMGGMMAMPVGFAFATPMIMMPVIFVMSGAPALTSAPAQLPDAQPPVAEQPGPVVPEAKAPAAAPVPDDVSESGRESRKPDARAVVEVDAEDFKRFRRSELSAELSSSLVLELTTKEGDSVKLDFNQLDLLERSSFKGKTLEGDREQSQSLEESTERMVNMSVDGDLSDAEKTSIDAVLASVIEVANRFFENDLSAALDKLKMMDFDTSTLADFSLKMTMTKSVDFSRETGGANLDGLQRLADRDGEVSRVLEFFADEQRKLIDSASEVLDRPSAIHMVKSLLPPMLEQPFAALSDKIAEANLDATADADADLEVAAGSETPDGDEVLA